MAHSFNIKVDSHIDDIEAAVENKINLALDLMGDTVEGYAKEDCPVDTGLLRNSITHVLGGGSVNSTYHASYGSNRVGGKRVSASSLDAGSVRIGSVSGTMGTSGDRCCYVGTNVEYAPYVEFLDRYRHDVGKAHFLRDGAQNHVNEIKAIAETTLSSL